MAKRWWLCGVLLAIGCADDPEPVSTGVAQFQYAPCTADCAVGEAALVAGGARATIAVTLPEGRTFASVKSTVPSVAQFRKNGERIEVQTGVPGRTQLLLVDGGGKEVDRTWVTVDRAGRFDYRTPWNTVRPIILEGVEQRWEVFPVRADGQTLLGAGAVRFVGSVAVEMTSDTKNSDSVRFRAEPGLVTVSAVCDDTTGRLEIEVAPASAINKVVADAVLKTTDPDGTVHYKVQTLAGIASGSDLVPVFGAGCTWQTDQENLEIGQQVVGSLDSDGAASLTDFALRTAGSYKATCTTGSATTTISLTR